MCRGQATPSPPASANSVQTPARAQGRGSPRLVSHGASQGPKKLQLSTLEAGLSSRPFLAVLVPLSHFHILLIIPVPPK